MRRKGIAHNEKSKEKRKRGRPPKNKPVQIMQEDHQAAPDHKLNTVKKDAPETSYFIMCNGKPVKNIKELADVMGELEDQVFNHHVNNEKNDFAKWIKDIFNDIELAEKLAGVKEKKHMQLVLYKHITHKLW